MDTIKINNLIVQKFIDYGYFEDYMYYLYNNKIHLVTMRYNEVNEELKEFFFGEMKKDYIKIKGHERYDEFYSLLYPTNRSRFDNVIKLQ